MALLTVFLLVATSASLLASPAFSADGGFRATVNHVDHGKKLSPDELFQRAVQRTKAGAEWRQSKKNPTVLSKNIEPSEYGEFSMRLTIGTPPITYLAIIDTDTDLMWTFCKSMRCLHTRNCNSSIRYDPTKSTTYAKLSCATNFCKQAANTSCNVKEDSCTYKHDILRGSDTPSWTKGDLAFERFGGYNGKSSFGKFVFGCAHTISEDLGGVDSGFVGLGRGILSLTSQMKTSKFSHCFPSYDNLNATGVIAFGAQVKKNPQNGKRVVITTDLIENQLKSSSAYYVSLSGVKVNGVALALDSTAFQIDGKGRGGTAMDSGMTVSYLDKGVYKKLKEKLVSVIKLERASGEKIVLDLCFVVPKGLDPKGYDKLFPSISFTFSNGNRRGDLLFQTGNVFRSYDDEAHGEITCLAMLPAPDSDGRTSIGNIQLQQTLVVYDFAAKKVSFVPKVDCAKM